MRICLVYDHIYPETIGGAERWMRELAVGLASAGHEITYLTMRHWRGRDTPKLPGVQVLGLTEPKRVYKRQRRTVGPPLRFGLAVTRHLAVHGKTYDVVHTAAFPYFALLAVGALRRRGEYAVFVDWHEVWTRSYWRRYAGPILGSIGWRVQKACVRLPHTAFCMSHLHADRLAGEGYRGVPTILPGLYSGPVEPTPSDRVDPALVVYAGRHVREKRLDALVRGFARAYSERPELRLEIFGDGPERPRIEMLVQQLGLSSAVAVLGRRPEEEVARAMARAACLATASEREGYGLVVVEAAARGTPSVVVSGSENATLELVREGINGAVAPNSTPESLAGALIRVIDAGSSLRTSTAEWFAANASSLQIDRSLELVLASYAQLTDGDSRHKGTGS